MKKQRQAEAPEWCYVLVAPDGRVATVNMEFGSREVFVAGFSTRELARRHAARYYGGVPLKVGLLPPAELAKVGTEGRLLVAIDPLFHALGTHVRLIGPAERLEALRREFLEHYPDPPRRPAGAAHVEN